MYIAIDVILAAIIGAVIIGAAKKGFIRSAFQLCSTIASIVIAVMFYKELSVWLCDKYIYSLTVEHIGGILENFAVELTAATDLSKIADALPEQVHSTAELLGINITEALEGLAGQESLVSTDALGESISLPVATVISNIIAFAALFFASLIVLNLICFILDKVAKLPILKGANRFLGFILGVIEGFVLGMVVAKVIEALCSAYGALNPDFAFTDVAGSTYIARFLIDVCPW